MKIAIVTGVSRGLGESIAKFLLESNINVVGISRNDSEHLTGIAKSNDLNYTHFKCDLGNLEETDETIIRVKEHITKEGFTDLYVINNAATVQPIHRSSAIHSRDLAHHYQLNVLTPMMFINTFLNICNDEDNSLIGVNITSGAATRAVYGWSAYSSSKASIDMYTKTVALEQEELETGNKIIAFNPSVMNTEMQVEIRSSNHNEFIDVDTFKDYKKANVLKDTDAVASVLVDIITDEVTIQNGKIYNVNEYY